MKKIVAINTVNYGSTGNMMLNLAEQSRKSGFECYTFCQDGHAQLKGIAGNEFIGDWKEKRLSDALNTLIGSQGSLNKCGTKRFLKRLDELQPDLIHLHNLHSNFINLDMLFSYLKTKDIPVVWTLHDCWAFTGHCPHFVTAGCERWKTGCHDCPLYREYPATLIDRSAVMYEKKKAMFNGVGNMSLVVPSQWMGRFLPDSFLKDYSYQVIYNGIDQTVFSPKTNSFRQTHNLEDKYLILTVAFPWTEQKGLDRVLHLADQLDDDYQIVMIGAENISHDRILCIPRTNNAAALAEIYTAADVLLNASRVESFGLTNIEALACGTPVISYGAGGNIETFDETCGRLVTDDTLLPTVYDLRKNPLFGEACRIFAKRFSLQNMYDAYLDLYQKMIG